MDDATAERLLRGSASAETPELEPLALLLSEVRGLAATSPAPTPSLAALLRDGFQPPVVPSAVPVRSPLRRRLAAVAGLSLGLKVLTGTGVALAGVAGAAGAGVLPAPVQDGVSSVVRTITPFELEPRQAPPAAPATPEQQPAGDVPAAPEPPRAEPTLPEPAPIDEPARSEPESRPAPAEQRPGQAPEQAPRDEPQRQDERASERPAPAPEPQERPGSPGPNGSDASGEQRDREEGAADAQDSAASRSNTGASRSR